MGYTLMNWFGWLVLIMLDEGREGVTCGCMFDAVIDG